MGHGFCALVDGSAFESHDHSGRVAVSRQRSPSRSQAFFDSAFPRQSLHCLLHTITHYIHTLHEYLALELLFNCRLLKHWGMEIENMYYLES